LQLHWCLKGIPESSTFGDAEALRLLTRGLTSAWLRRNGRRFLSTGLARAQSALSKEALVDHVNDYAKVGGRTPYISLSAGNVAANPSRPGVLVRPAWLTALDFATRGGRVPGYVLRCWTVVSPQPASGILALADEVRDLNLFRAFWVFQDEGEIAAKLLVPANQIEWVQKFDPGPNRTSFGLRRNRKFIDPRTVCNLIEAVQ